MSDWQDIIVVRALGGLGDVIAVTPALRRLRDANPAARISYIGLPQVAPVVARLGDLVDRFLPFPGFPGIPEMPYRADALRRFLDERAAEPPADIAIQMHGSGSVTNVFTAMLGARATAGWHVPGLWCPDPKHFAPFPDSLSEIERWVALVERLGCPGAGLQCEFPVGDDDRAALAEAAPELADKPFAVLHPGASDPVRRWPADRFAAVGDRLASEGLRVVITGTPAEAAIAGALAQMMHTPALNLCGRTGLGAMAALIERAAIVVTNDTGTAHLSAACRTPSVTIFMASDPARWAAPYRRRHVAVGQGIPDVPVGEFRPCAEPVLPPVDQVIIAATDLLEIA